MAERKVLHDSVTPLPGGPALMATGILQHGTKPEDLTRRMRLQFALRPPAERQAELEAKVAEGVVVSPTEIRDAYGAADASVDALTAWLTGQGFDVDEVTADGTSIYASAPLSVIESSLGVDMVRVSKEGVTYPAARNAPSLPVDVAQDVRAIIGLQPYRHPRKHLRRARPALADAAGSGAGASRPDGYLVSDLLRAYGAEGLDATGAGQVIGILIDTFPDDDDLKAFWHANGLSEDLSRITKINVGGGELPPIEGEESLDAQWASGMAPGAEVRVYAAGAFSFVAIDRALDRILDDLPSQPGLRQLAISFGLGETYFGNATAEVAVQHDKFLRLAAAGVNVFVSSGDAGSNPDPTGHSSTGALQVEYVASDPCVVSVGGTTLRLNADGTVAEETAWPGSGGGKSVRFTRPAWQKARGVPDGGERLVPDVSVVGDPETGGMVVMYGIPRSVGGTSWSAPVWAAFCARLNEARGKAGKASLGFLNPLVYPLCETASFRDITDGTNGAYSACAGYNMVTGLGTPDITELAAALT